MISDQTAHLYQARRVLFIIYSMKGTKWRIASIRSRMELDMGKSISIKMIPNISNED